MRQIYFNCAVASSLDFLPTLLAVLLREASDLSRSDIGLGKRISESPRLRLYGKCDLDVIVLFFDLVLDKIDEVGGLFLGQR